MKLTKKLLSTLLALAMVFTLAVPAFAANETFTVKIKNTVDGHTYKAYQIFAGDLSGEKLSNIVWGTGITTEGKDELLNFGVEENGVPYDSPASLAAALNDENAKAFAIEVANYLATEATGTSTDKGDYYEIADLPAGYYLIKDDVADNTHSAHTSYILKLVKDQDVNVKSVFPTVDKQVLDETADAEEGHTDGWGETADHAINETFQFKLMANLPAITDYNAYDDYETYKVIFTDTMSNGITFESIESVTVDDVEFKNYKTEGVTEGDAGKTWTLTIDNVKVDGVNLADGAEVVVIYNAHLNENAKVGNVDTNKNTVYLQYSNNPYVEGDLGKTTEDHVWVFTYEVDNTKVDDKNKPLAGAEFKLYTAIKDNEGVTGSEIPLIYDDNLKAYRPVKTGETAEAMVSAEGTGVFNIVGLDIGTYYLVETKTPEGYNTCAPVSFTISAIHKESEDGTTATTLNDTAAPGATNTIVNRSGTELPSTGGIGTTLFYLGGGAMFLGALVMLVTKKRMKD